MFVGVLQVELALGKTQSLKEKRQVVKSLLGRVRAAFNVSAAEVDALDQWRRAVVGFAAVANDATYVRGLLDRVLDHLRRHPEARVVDHRLEVM